jgi:hypothetical protein
MLLTYDNLWVDLSWVVYDLCLVLGGKPNPEWVELVKKYPDRFKIGSDAIGHFQDYNQTIRRYISSWTRYPPVLLKMWLAIILLGFYIRVFTPYNKNLSK